MGAERPATQRTFRLILMGIVAYTTVLSAIALLRYYSFQTLYFDLGIHTYSMAQILRGQAGLATLVLPSTPGHVGHFSPVLVLALAFYSLLPTPPTLLVLQSFLLGTAAIPLFSLARAVLGDDRRAGTVALLYLLYPALAGANLYDFHVEAFVPLLSFAALLALVRDKYCWFVVASLLLVSTHEFVSIMFVWTGAILVARHIHTRRAVLRALISKRYSLTVLILGGLFLALADISNRLLTPTHGSILEWANMITAGYSGFSNAPLSGVTVDLGSKLVYWLLLLIPLLLLPLREWPLALPAVPWIGVTMLSSNPAFYSIEYQYSLFVIAPIFFALVFAMRRPKSWVVPSLTPQRAPAVLLASTLIFASVLSPLSPVNPWQGALAAGTSEPYPPQVTSHDIATARLLGLVPHDATVLAQNELFSQLSDRRTVSLTWNISRSGPPDFIAVDAALRWFGSRVPSEPLSTNEYLEGIVRTHPYGVAGFEGAAVVYQINRSVEPSFSEPIVCLAGCASPPAWTVTGGTLSLSGGGVQLTPSQGGEMLAWVALPRPVDSLLAIGHLSISNGTIASAESGFTFVTAGATPALTVYLEPASGTVHVVRYGLPAATDNVIGTYDATQPMLYITLLVGGGSVVVFVDGRLGGAAYGLPVESISAFGLASAGEDAAVSSLIAFRSTAADNAWPAPIPADGIVAVVTLVLPTVGFLWFLPRMSPWPRRLAALLNQRFRFGR